MGRLVAVLALAVGAAACSTGGTGEGAEADVPVAPFVADLVRDFCESSRDLHNEVAETANRMAEAEIVADPRTRAEIIATGYEAMIRIVADAELARRPAALVAGMAERRDRVVAELEADAADFRRRWRVVSDADRTAAVSRVFVRGEKLLSETEAKVSVDTDPVILAAVRQEPACRYVIQLPPA